MFCNCVVRVISNCGVFKMARIDGTVQLECLCEVISIKPSNSFKRVGCNACNFLMHDILATFNKSSCLNISLSKREVNPAIIINICDSVTGDE